MKFTPGELREIAARTYWAWARENPAEAQARVQGKPWPPAAAADPSPKRPGRRQTAKPRPGSMAYLREIHRRGRAAAAARRRARYRPRYGWSWRRR